MLQRRRTNNRIIIAAAIALSAAISIFHRTVTKAHEIDPLDLVTRRLLLAPGLTAEQSIFQANQLTLTGWLHGSRLARENVALKEKIAALEMANADLQEQSAENEQLRQMLDLPGRTTWKLATADVLALKPSPLHDTMLLSVNGLSHVHLQNAVLAVDGDLLGQIVQVSGRTGDAMLLTDPLSSVGARVAAVGRPEPGKAVVGICVGNRSRTLRMIDLPGDADIQVGDQIVTSGLGGVYPPDLRIGSVIEVQTDNARFLKSATVAPAADFNRQREVFLRQ